MRRSSFAIHLATAFLRSFIARADLTRTPPRIPPRPVEEPLSSRSVLSGNGGSSSGVMATIPSKPLTSRNDSTITCIPDAAKLAFHSETRNSSLLMGIPLYDAKPRGAWCIRLQPDPLFDASLSYRAHRLHKRPTGPCRTNNPLLVLPSAACCC